MCRSITPSVSSAGLGVGATFVYSGNNQRLAGKKISTDYYSIMPHLKMRWLNLRIPSLYSRIGVGLTFTESSGEGRANRPGSGLSGFTDRCRNRGQGRGLCRSGDRYDGIACCRSSLPLLTDRSSVGDIATDRLSGRFEKERCCVAFAGILRLACDAGDLPAKERSYSNERERKMWLTFRFARIFGKNEKNRISKLHCFEVLFFQCRSRGRLAVL